MSKRNVRGTLFSCDAPGCDVSRFQEAGGEPVEGLQGNVFEVHEIGGQGEDWWACSRAHAGPALQAAIEGKLDG